jgi:hypothetical protein
MSVNHTGLPMEDVESVPANFDLEAWLSGARPPERAVTVYGRADLVATLEELEAEYDAARTTDRRLGGPADDLRRRIREVREELESSRLTIRVRSLDRDTQNEHVERFQSTEGITEADMAVVQIAAAAVAPRMTEEQAVRLMDRIGWGQFRSLADAVFRVSTDKTVTVPFSRAASEDTPES